MFAIASFHLSGRLSTFESIKQRLIRRLRKEYLDLLSFVERMSSSIPNHISVTVTPTFGELFIASLILLKYRRGLLIIHAIFPLFGLYLLMTPFMGYGLGIIEILLALFLFSFTPLVTALQIWFSRRYNKLAQGPFTYSFDANGVHTTGEAFHQTIHWTAIPRVRYSPRFLFIFIAPAQAFCIPLRTINNPRFLDELRRIAGEQTDFKPN